jgi:hypothetical protein
MFGKTKTMSLPVMDNKHKAVDDPNSRQVSDCIMRCLVKNIALFGIGLKMYQKDGIQDYIQTKEQNDQLAQIFKNVYKGNGNAFFKDCAKWIGRQDFKSFNEFNGLEADAIRKKASIFVDKLGEQVTSPLCTIVDDGTLEYGTGSFDYDSEGTPSQYNVLIENGVLKTYMYDKLNAKLMGAKPTGNGRRQGYNVAPIPRMTNTYMLPGESDPNDIIKSIDKGIYAISFEGGQVNPASGNFTFGASEAYYVENGEVCYPIKGVTLIGNCIDVMKKVSMVGNDLKFDKGVGRCGKQGQSVPVGIGQPTLRLDSITIGGTK